MQIGFLSVLIQVLVLLGRRLAFIRNWFARLGLACVRLKAWYLAIVTFGFSVIAETLSSHFIPSQTE